MWINCTVNIVVHFDSYLCMMACIVIVDRHLLTPWCRVLLEKLTGLQLVKKFPALHGTRRFIIALTSVRHLSLSWASPIQSIYHTHLLEIHPNIIHPSTPRSPQWSLSLRFPHQDPIHPSLLTHTRHMPNPSHSSRFYHPHSIGRGVQIFPSLNFLKTDLASDLHFPEERVNLAWETWEH